MGSSRPERWRAALATLLMQLAVVLAMVLYYHGNPPGDGAVRITTAQALPVAAGPYDADPREAPPMARLASAGTAQPLPLRWSRRLAPAGNAPAADAEVHWLQMALPTTPTLPTGGGPRHVYIPRWQTIGTLAVYADDRLVYQTRADLVWNGFNHPLLLQLDEPGLPPARRLTVRLASRSGAGGALSAPWVGSEDQLQPPYRARQVLQVLLPEYVSVAAMGLALFAFGVWLGRRDEKLPLLFALIALMFWLRGLHHHMGLRPLPIPSEWFGWLTVNSVNVATVTWYSFIAALLVGLPRWPGRLLWGFSMLGVLVTLPLPNPWLAPEALAPLWYMGTAVLGTLSIAWAGWQSWRQGSLQGIGATVIGLVDFALAFYDLGLVTYSLPPEGFYTVSIVAVFHLSFFAWVLLQRYLGAVRTAEQANQVLALRLREREAELQASHEQLREVQEREAVHRERQRLMQDLHDGMGAQLMSALRVAETGRLDEAQMQAVLRECIDDLKLTVDSLEPTDSDLPLLLATLRYRLSTRIERAGLDIDWQIGDLPPLPWLEPRSGLHVLRILQEAFSNVLQHAAATRLRVSTAVEDAGVVVLVDDDGRGFAADNPPAPGAAVPGGAGRGLANMRRRAAVLGGDVQWQAGPLGTRLRLWLPLQRGGQAPAA